MNKHPSAMSFESHESMDIYSTKKTDDVTSNVPPLVTKTAQGPPSDKSNRSMRKTTYETRFYGKEPGRIVQVTHKCESDPQNMLKGMEEFLFK